MTEGRRRPPRHPGRPAPRPRSHPLFRRRLRRRRHRHRRRRRRRRRRHLRHRRRHRRRRLRRARRRAHRRSTRRRRRRYRRRRRRRCRRRARSRRFASTSSRCRPRPRRVSLPAALLPPDGEFVFTLAVGDAFGRHAHTSHLVASARQPLPHVTIAGPPELEVAADAPLRLHGLAALAACHTDGSTEFGPVGASATRTSLRGGAVSPPSRSPSSSTAHAMYSATPSLGTPRRRAAVRARRRLPPRCSAAGRHSTRASARSRCPPASSPTAQAIRSTSPLGSSARYRCSPRAPPCECRCARRRRGGCRSAAATGASAAARALC